MRTIRRWLPLLLVGVPLLGAAAFGGGIVVTDHLEEISSSSGAHRV